MFIVSLFIRRLIILELYLKHAVRQEDASMHLDKRDSSFGLFGGMLHMCQQ